MIKAIDEADTPRQNMTRAEGVAVGYLRRSTDRQEQSIPDQKKAIEKYAEDQGFRVIRFYTDDAISGTSTVGRRAFQALMADAKGKRCEFRYVIVYDVKRFGRIDNDEAGYYRHLLRSNGIEVRYVTENFTGDRTDDLLRPVKQWQAREESKDLSKVTIRGLLSKSETGAWMGGVPPLGYDLRYEGSSGGFIMYVRHMADGSKQIFDEKWKLQRTLARGESIAISRKDRCRLVLSEQPRVKTVREIFRLYVQDRRGFKAIADALNRRGVPTSRGAGWSTRCSGKWAITTVRAILVNPAYCGDMVWNRRTDARFHRITDGRAIERGEINNGRLSPNVESDWIVVKNAHEGIVTRRVWELAKSLREAQEASRLQRGINPRTGDLAGQPVTITAGLEGGWTGPRAKFLLSGLMTCSRCGNLYEGHSQYTKAIDDQGKRVRHLGYACGGYIRHGRSVCTIGRVAKEELEQPVIEAMLAFYSPFAGKNAREAIAAALELQIGSDRKKIEDRQAKLASALSTIDRKIRNLLDNITTANRELVDERLKELTKEKERLEIKQQSLQHLSMCEEEQREIISDTAKFTAALESTLRDGALDERQAAMRRCVEKMIFDRDDQKIGITFRKLPTVVRGSLTAATEAVVVGLPEEAVPSGSSEARIG